MRHSNALWLSIIFVAMLRFGQPVVASFHLMQIQEVIGGVNGDTSSQAIQLRMRAGGQNFPHTDAGGTLGPARLIAMDANGANPISLIVFPNDVTNGVVGNTILISSPQFSHDVGPAFDSTNKGTDFTLTNLIPSSYLAAGRIDYVDVVGDVLWSLSYGGAKYKGPTAVANFNGTFGAPFSGTLPSSNLQALQFQGVASSASTANSTDYSLTSGAAGFTNNFSKSFQVVPEPSCAGLLSLAGVSLLRRSRRQ